MEAEIKLAAGEKPQLNWTHDTRLEELDAKHPYYWWKVGTLTLQPGEYRLQLAPTAAASHKSMIAVDAAFLSTSTELVYPFLGDLDAPPASYLRFRIDQPPKQGLTIGAQSAIHYFPWGTGHGWLNPDQLGKTKAEPHKKAGYTRWYRLQDLDKAPAFGTAEAHLQLDLNPSPDAAKIRGTAQFAVFPHADNCAARDGLERAGGLADFAADGLQNLFAPLTNISGPRRREDYDLALLATAEQVFPLTQTICILGTWGRAAMVSASTIWPRPYACWGSTASAKRTKRSSIASSMVGPVRTQYEVPDSPLPFDEIASRQSLDKTYRHFFDNEREFWQGVPIFQLADEPSELSREAMSRTLVGVFTGTRRQRTLFRREWQQPVDQPGSYDLKDCVLEGTIEKQESWLGFRVAVDDAENPTRYAYWRVGKVGGGPQNVAAGKVGLGSAMETSTKRPTADMLSPPTQFKIVYDGTTAVMYLDGQLVHQQVDLPSTGGFTLLGTAESHLEAATQAVASGGARRGVCRRGRRREKGNRSARRPER